ncbi:PREDICTED: RPII140-upstream gene protein [Vollenhovia emeryi]|uniref:RPII140-upstream gene protein n=1 Tax=Vollenhovia emeryi TaxID=411798 RepID=UPI0005F3A404|nr:PREDICTED: RPII140-upstream gene protein [Vollenhovia emeryi]XP_011870945.1 PREDICTED: RPII140-upstream gene protein [Vollenhovia emeryi]XP_011870946.1 PREDICTED: RPII140-upstream gene protein [Vollenhovia emeryi]XP_011870947.1 PREDICTED: RPII140-upstream gene protein [Vollenhovia emeryi]
MIRLLSRSPMLMFILPIDKQDNQFDKPANAILKPLDDELGWDRVKNIFSFDENGYYSKHLQSIINVTLSGIVLGVGIGGIGATKNTVNSFIVNNEATRFPSHFDAKRELQKSISMNFFKKGGRLGAKLGMFCFIFSSVATCTTVYRGKMAIENYMLGGFITGLLFKMNLGLRASLVGAGLGGALGGVCGGLSLLILTVSGISMDEALDAQQQWVLSRNDKTRELIKQVMDNEVPEIQKIYEENRRLRDNIQQMDIENQKK